MAIEVYDFPLEHSDETGFKVSVLGKKDSTHILSSSEVPAEMIAIKQAFAGIGVIYAGPTAPVEDVMNADKSTMDNYVTAVSREENMAAALTVGRHHTRMYRSLEGRPRMLFVRNIGRVVSNPFYN